MLNKLLNKTNKTTKGKTRKYTKMPKIQKKQQSEKAFGRFVCLRKHTNLPCLHITANP